MEIFEYLMVMVSIILGLGVTQILRGLSKLARGERPSSIVTTWAALLFTLHLQVWWALWDLHQVEQWTQVYFFFVVAIPCSLFAMAELLLPMGSAPETDWRAHFFSIRVWFFRLYLLFLVMATLETWVFLDTPLTHPYRIMQLLQLALALVGLNTTNLRTHHWLPAISIVMLLVGQVLFRLLPGLGS
jgi:hypothetical protein